MRNCCARRWWSCRPNGAGAVTSTTSTSSRPTRATSSAPRLAERGIGAAVHYPTPVHLQPAYRELAVLGGFPVAESLCSRVLSLPLSPDHTDEEIAEVAAALVELSARSG